MFIKYNYYKSEVLCPFKTTVFTAKKRNGQQNKKSKQIANLLNCFCILLFFRITFLFPKIQKMWGKTLPFHINMLYFFDICFLKNILIIKIKII